MSRTDWLFTPRNGLTLWALYHLVVWTLLPLICNTCLPLDSIEAVMWGSQWEWGYDKHPPLSAWLPELFTDAFGDAGLYLLSQICVVSAGLGIYKLGRLLGSTAKQAVMAVLLLDTIYFYQFISVEFNVNIVQMPFWAWGWFFGMHGLKHRNYASWIGLGACVALAALSKYIGVFLLAPLFAAWWARGELKKVLTTPGIYVAGIVSILIFLPHLIWMKNNDWMTITYGLRRGASAESLWWHHLWNPLEFILMQSAILLPVIIVALIGRRKGRGEAAPAGTMMLALGCYGALALLSLAIGMAPVTMWAAPMPLAIGLWLVPRCGLERIPRTVVTTIAIMSFLFVTAYAVTYGLGPQIRKKPHRVTHPGKALAVAVEKHWHDQFDRPLVYVIGHEFYGGIVNHYGEDEAAVMIRGKLERSAYLTEEQVHEQGAIVLWLKSRFADSDKTRSLDEVFPDLRERYPQMIEQEDLLVPWPRKSDGLQGRYGIAVIPPKS